VCDVLLSAFVFGLLLFVFRYPAIGPYLWAWLSLMNPHKLTYGFANQFGFALIVAIVTIFTVFLTRKRQAYPFTPVTIVWLLFVAWMSFTSLFALNDPVLVLERWIFVMKIQLMMVVTLLLIDSRAKLQLLIWIVTFSIAFYGIKGGIFTVLSGGAYRVWGPQDSMVQENNSLAVALVMLIPLMYYLFQTSSRGVVRLILAICILTAFVSVLGSQSRGALVAVLAMTLFLALKSRHRIRMGVGLALLLALGFVLMPDSWIERMSTIANYEADSSAMSRLYTWKTLWNLALDRPLVGGGFRSDALVVFERYGPIGPDFEALRGSIWVAHSIYLQTLGEHGFVGLGLFILLGFLTWRRAGQLARLTVGDPEFGDWVPRLMPMVQVSLIGFAAGGAYLSLAYFGLPYYVVGFVVLVDALVRRRQQSVRNSVESSPSARLRRVNQA